MKKSIIVSLFFGLLLQPCVSVGMRQDAVSCQERSDVPTQTVERKGMLGSLWDFLNNHVFFCIQRDDNENELYEDAGDEQGILGDVSEEIFLKNLCAFLSVGTLEKMRAVSPKLRDAIETCYDNQFSDVSKNCLIVVSLVDFFKNEKAFERGMTVLERAKNKGQAVVLTLAGNNQFHLMKNNYPSLFEKISRLSGCCYFARDLDPESLGEILSILRRYKGRIRNSLVSFERTQRRLRFFVRGVGAVVYGANSVMLSFLWYLDQGAVSAGPLSGTDLEPERPSLAVFYLCAGGLLITSMIVSLVYKPGDMFCEAFADMGLRRPARNVSSLFKEVERLFAKKEEILKAAEEKRRKEIAAERERQRVSVQAAAGEKRKLRQRRCHSCKKQGLGYQRCGKCLLVRYCSRECQRNDWKNGHKEECEDREALKQKLKKERRERKKARWALEKKLDKKEKKHKSKKRRSRKKKVNK